MENRQTDQIYQEIHKNMQKYPKGKCLENHMPTGQIPYFLRFFFDLFNLHMVKVKDSNPAFFYFTARDVSVPKIGQNRRKLFVFVCLGMVTLTYVFTGD